MSHLEMVEVEVTPKFIPCQKQHFVTSKALGVRLKRSWMELPKIPLDTVPPKSESSNYQQFMTSFVLPLYSVVVVVFVSFGLYLS